MGRNWNGCLRWAAALCVTMAMARAAGADRIELIAGGGEKAEGKATECRLDRPFASDRDRSGTLYIAEESSRVLAVDRAGRLRLVAGSGEPGDSGDNGPAKEARVNAPHHLLVLPSGDVLIADTMNHRVRRIDPKSGKIFAFAGTGAAGYSGDGGPALEARFGAVYCLALDRKRGLLYIDDLDNKRIRQIDLKTGIVSTAAGNGQRGVPTDGALAADGPLLDPRAIAVDASGNLYILERSGNTLRRVDPQGRIRTVAGTGKAGPAEDGDALTATLRGPKHLAADRDNNVLIADTDNNVIRKYIVREQRIVRVAGTGAKGAGGEGGPPKDAGLNQPHGVYLDGSGTLYICDSLNNRVLRIVRE